ncbi:MAG: 4-hydroxy-tetrahydrodipicolinate reductase [Leucobacter sp.]|nr:4-hydroxy-tetrahydrodipicolinate reductase [Leucobacter sp.]
MKVAVAGASGRLGVLVCEVVEQHPELELVAKIGRDSPIEAAAEADVVVDVTHLEASRGIVSRALVRGQKVIIGTSGYDESELELLRQRVTSAQGTALVVPNFSLGSVIGTMLARVAAPYFSSIEIIEAHHENKIDSPSGTAVRTAELIAEARAGAPIDAPFADQAARGELIAGVPVHSLRLQGVVAKQEVRFGGAGEVLTITHDTHSKDAYRAGLRAAFEAIGALDGLVVGLEQVLQIGSGTRAGEAAQ